ncbi:MAG: prolyl oligopeptidase family serine peptidase [Parvularculaceae bacterium]
MGVLIAAFLGWSAAPSSFAADPIPIEDLARLPLITSASLSDDGRHMVALVANRGAETDTPALSVWDLDDPKGKPVVAEAASDVEFIHAVALKGGRVLAYARKPYTGQTFGCIESSGGFARTYQFKVLFADHALRDFDDPSAASGIMIGRDEITKRCFELAVTWEVREDLLTLDPENIVISEFDTSSFRVEYKKHNLKTGRTENLFADMSDRPATLIDPRDARVWAREASEASDGTYRNDIYLRDAATGDFSAHKPLSTRFDERKTVSVVGRDEETGKFYIVTDQFSDRLAVYFYDPVAQKYDPEPLFAHSAFSAIGVLLGESQGDFNKLLGYFYYAERPKIWWVDPEFSSIQTQLEKIFEEMDVEIVDFSTDRSRILFEVKRSDRPAKLYLLRNKSQISLVGETAPWIDPAKTGRTELVYYTARDGLRIPGFLTRPAGWKAGDAPGPAVVLPHGGPWARDDDNWDGWVQYFASRGFAVLKPQYRGSEGFGSKLWLAGDAEWGQKMQDDKDDGARWLVSEGLADPERIIIFGYSYGGFAAFAATVREGGPFKCAIAGAGVSDLKNLGANWSDDRRQRLYQGRTVKGMNPIDNTQKANIPILIFHGDRDVRVPLSHSVTFYNKVKNKIPARLVEITDMPHQYPWRAQWQRQIFEAIDAFLEGDCKL